MDELVWTVGRSVHSAGEIKVIFNTYVMLYNISKALQNFNLTKLIQNLLLAFPSLLLPISTPFFLLFVPYPITTTRWW